MSAARVALDGAIKGLDVVKATYKIGVKAISALSNFIFTKIFNIHEIYFNVRLSEANGGKFLCGMKYVVYGKSLNVQRVVDTRDIWPLIIYFAEITNPGLSSFISPIY